MYSAISLVIVIAVTANGVSLAKHSDFKAQSDHETHASHGEHNLSFDHEAFLGAEADAFNSITPDESKRRLGLIFSKIDVNNDGFLNSSELTKWIQYTQKRYIIEDGRKQWNIHNPANKEKITWEDYRRVTYSFLENEPQESEDYKTFSRMMGRDRRRWSAADMDGDDALSMEEFQNFLHPEEVAYMHDIIVVETIEDIDKDGDGKVSVDEYISDLYRGDEGEEEPGWVQRERDTFISFRDADKDGFLSNAEVKQWIMPADYDHAIAEAAHLISSSDGNKDGKLTKAEVLDHYDVFVGSQATDFGEVLNKHEEF